MTGFLKAPFYDAKKVSPDAIKGKGLKVLLEPQFKEKIIWHDPSIPGSGQSFAYILRSRLGDDGLRKLVVDQRVAFTPQQDQIVEALVRGIATVGIGPIVPALLGPYRAAGLDPDIRAFGNTPDVNEMSIGGAALYVFNRRPNPNATKVFVNWVLSEDIQAAFSKVMLQESRRADVDAVSSPDRMPIKGAKYLETQREEHVRDVEEAAKFVRALRRSVN
jgi:ABC-type Fe3+ transport system substrate-binding protein